MYLKCSFEILAGIGTILMLNDKQAKSAKADSKELGVYNPITGWSDS